MCKTIAVVTVFYPQEEHRNNIEKIAKQVDRIIICDNSPKDNRHLFKMIFNAYYIYKEKNLGLSASFNNVLTNENISWKDEDFVIFFDQDSVVSDNHVKKLEDEFRLLISENYKVGCLGPFFYNTSNNLIEVPKIKEHLNDRTIKVKDIITSSMLCKYSTLKEIGFWNEEIFLDMADWDICWRMRKKNYICCMTQNTILNHSVGEGSRNVGILKLRVHKPFREYYRVRDSLYLLKKDYTPVMYKLKFIFRLVTRPIVILLFLEDKKSRLSYIKKAILDYRKNVKGELRDE